jgi:hypothetical protein
MKKYIYDIKNKLIALGTNSETSRVIVCYLSAWMNDDNLQSIKEIAPEASPYLVKTIKHQNNIGWQHWFNGQISSYWRDLYKFDIEKQECQLKYPSVEHWGKEIILLVW